MTSHSNHPFHLVEKSPWPLTASLGAMFITSGLTKWFHLYSTNLLALGLFSVALSSVLWWRDISREGTFQGLHTFKVTTGLRWGMILFIVSEVCFFFSFFWAFFNPFQIPLLNTAVLLASGVTVTWAHHAVTEGSHSQSVQGLALTIFLGLYFTALQGLEYVEASFSVADSVYGSTFFVATGFHGLHVIIGTTFLLTCLVRLNAAHFSASHHMGLEAAIWYWHFVDVVWLFLYVSIYWWGN